MKKSLRSNMISAKEALRYSKGSDTFKTYEMECVMSDILDACKQHKRSVRIGYGIIHKQTKANLIELGYDIDVYYTKENESIIEISWDKEFTNNED